MKKISAAIRIPAGPEAVWQELVSFDKYSEWNPFITFAEGMPKTGSEAQLHVKLPGYDEIIYTATISSVRKARKLRWISHLWLPFLLDQAHEFLMRPIDGDTLFVQEITYKGLLVRFFGERIAAAQEAMESMNEALKKRAR